MMKAGAAATVGAMIKPVRGQGKAHVDKRPNILLIFSDQQHWQAMGFVDPFFETPNLDALAQDSIVFERSFCSTPQCSPSRASLLTGFYPSTTKVMGNTGSAGGNHLDQATIASELRAAGYRTGYFGKWHLGEKAVAGGGWDQKRFQTDDEVAKEGALGFLRASDAGSNPFALFVSINNPHDIYEFRHHKTGDEKIPLPASWEKETFEGKPPIQRQFMAEDQGKVIAGESRDAWMQYRDCYREKTRLYDQQVGVILDELKRQGQWENTVVIVTSDHGDMDAQHRLILKGPFMYEHMVRVPLLIRLPKAFGGKGAKRVDDLDVVNVDLVPTIREFCGLAAYPSQGSSLVPVLTGAGGYQPREFVVSQYYSKQRWVNPIRMIRTKRFKLNRHIHWGDELYDLENDPDELVNRAGDPACAGIKAELGRKLDQWIKEHEDPFWSLNVTTRSGGSIHE